MAVTNTQSKSGCRPICDCSVTILVIRDFLLVRFCDSVLAYSFQHSLNQLLFLFFLFAFCLSRFVFENFVSEKKSDKK